MKRFCLIVLLFAVMVSPAMATNVYSFAALATTSNCVARMISQDDPDLWVGKGKTQCYRIIVTGEQYTNGWVALPQAVKDAGFVDAEDWRDDYDNAPANIIAALEALRFYVSMSMTNQGLQELTKTKLKQKFKEKKPKK